MSLKSHLSPADDASYRRPGARCALGGQDLVNTDDQTASSRRKLRSASPLHNGNSAAPWVRDAQLPASVIVTVLALCILPSLLSLAGVDLSTQASAEAGANATDVKFHRLAGAFTHTLLEWSAVCTATFTVGLAFARFAVKRDVVTPVIALALMAAGSMDAFHTLAADRLISAEADNTDLIPFTWAICRLFNSIICALGVSFFLFTRQADWGRQRLRVVLGAGALFAVVAYAIIAVSASAVDLPQTQFPDSLITRPWDVGPLVVFFLSSFLFVALYRKYPTVFTYSLVLSTVPDLATQAHMALGSSHLFDAHFNIAHFLKIVAYAVPCAGLLVDYVRIHREEQVMIERLESSRNRLEFSHDELVVAHTHLERSNADLQQFAYIASHDLKAPLRGIGSLLDWVEEDLKEHDLKGVYEHIGRMRGRLGRMEALIEGVLKYSRLDETNTAVEQVDVAEILDSVRETVLPPDDSFQLRVLGSMPLLVTSRVLLLQVFSNLISNAEKHHDRTSGLVVVRCSVEGDCANFSVEDDGPGIEPRYHDKIFEIFQTLQPRDTKESTGIGLSLVKKLVLNNGGDLRVESSGIRGTTFFFSWRAKLAVRQGVA